MNSKSTLLALGNSYTIGEGVAEHERWPAILARRMQWGSPDYIAKTGWTAQELLEAIEKARMSHFYDWVSLQIGVNNQYRGLSLQQYHIEFEMLLYQALALNRKITKQIIVLSVPDYSVTPFAKEKNPPQIYDEINAYNAVNENIARREGVHYVNITDISRLAANNSKLLTHDNLHPSVHMYRLWVDRVQKTLHLHEIS